MKSRYIMMKMIGVNNTLTKISQPNHCDKASEEVKKMYQYTDKNKTKKQTNFARIYGKQSKEQKFETSYLKVIQEKGQIKEYKPLGPEFTAMSLYYSNRIH